MQDKVAAELEGDLIDRIFFAPPPGLVDEEEEETELEDHEDQDNRGEESRDYDSSFKTQPQRQQGQPSQPHAQPSNANASYSMEDLQAAQREQMEEAIGLMAQQMKEATQGIQSQLQQQTGHTLTQLETTVEQNMQDVTQVTQQVQTHNQRRSRQNWGTYTLLAMIAGTFVFVMMTIWTIPKRPNTCLILCRGGGQDVSLVGWLGAPIWVLGEAAFKAGQDLWQEYGAELFGFDLDATDVEEDDEKYDKMYQNLQEEAANWEDVYKEEADKAAQQEKDTLQKLLDSLKQQERKEKGQQKQQFRHTKEESAEKDLENENGRQEDAPTLVPSSPERTETKDNQSKAKPKAEDLDIDAFGGYNPVKKPKESNQDRKLPEPKEQKKKDGSPRRKFGDRATPGAGDPFGVGNAVEPKASGSTTPKNQKRLSEEQLRVSPKDIRVAAESGDAAKLGKLLELRPDFIDRADKNQWGPIHFAVRRGHIDAVRLLLEKGCDTDKKNKRGQTPLDLAVERLGGDHPIIHLLQSGGATTVMDIRQEDESNDEEDAQPEASDAMSTKAEEQNIPTKSSPKPLSKEEDTSLNLDAYLESGRSQLDKLLQSSSIEQRHQMKIQEEEESSQDLDQYTNKGRSRLDAVLERETSNPKHVEL